MTELKELLQSVGVVKALIVDDAYDECPRASDLSLDIDAWDIFVADLIPEDDEFFQNIFPELGGKKFSGALRGSDEFIRALWKNKDKFRDKLADPLFARYATEKFADLEKVDKLYEALEKLGLKCETSGRDFAKKANDADLIFIDLYLNSAQKPEDINISINGLKQVISDRKSNHPLVALMSNNNRLPEKRREFQTETAIFESCFRIIKKNELGDAAILNRLLVRLGTHYPDSKRVISFVGAWDAGLTAAKDRTTALMRKMRLSDIAQINRLLLTAEGEPTGSYLVDIFDKVLQHEIEGDRPIIDAALALNGISNEAYPPPYVPGSSDLQDLVYKSLFQHKQRLNLSGSADSFVALGDVLKRRAIVGEPAVEAGLTEAEKGIAAYYKRLLVELSDESVMVVLTPACDLQRTGAKKVMLLVGKLHPLTSASWSYKPDTKTPVIELPNEVRRWIKWDLKHVETLSHEELKYFLDGPNASFELVARLRESHALELQQKLLSNLGRVGLMAVMPATFQMKVEIGVADENGKYAKLNIPVLDDGGICFIGRNTDNDPLEMLVLTENACEEIYGAICAYEPLKVHTKGRANFMLMQKSGDLLIELEKGLQLPRAGSNKFKEVPIGEKPIGLIKRERIAEGFAIEGGLQKAAIIFTVFLDEAIATAE